MGNWLYISKKNNIQSLPNPSSFVNVNIKKSSNLKKCQDIQCKLDLINQVYLWIMTSVIQEDNQDYLGGMQLRVKQSAPYAEANMKAAEKTNPMNAKSQETPVGDRVDSFLKKMGG